MYYFIEVYSNENSHLTGRPAQEHNFIAKTLEEAYEVANGRPIIITDVAAGGDTVAEYLGEDNQIALGNIQE